MVIHKWDYFPAPSYTLLSICQKNGREDLKLCVSRFQKVCSMADDKSFFLIPASGVKASAPGISGSFLRSGQGSSICRDVVVFVSRTKSIYKGCSNHFTKPTPAPPQCQMHACSNWKINKSSFWNFK